MRKIIQRAAAVANWAALAGALATTLFFATSAAPQRSPVAPSPNASASTTPTFYRDVLPILQEHCQSCHRPGQVGTFPLVTYEQTRRYAAAVRDAVAARKMPPWFADPRYGHFSNDPSLSPQELAIVAAWANAGTPAGSPKDAPPRDWTTGWNISRPDRVLEMQKPVPLKAKGDIEYTYEIVPTGFTQDTWVEMAEVRPSSADHVHHAVVYIRPPKSEWLRNAPVGAPFTASSLSDEQLQHDAHWTDSDILLVYAPGSSPDRWPEGLGKLIPAGSDLVFQMHYVARGRAASDRTSVALVFAKAPPKQRVLTLQLTNDHFTIPPRADNYRVEARGSLPNDATLLSFFPHMHLRGKRFEYNLVHPDGQIEPLLQVKWDFYWQLSYKLAEPRLLKGGTILQAVGWYDNSNKNPHNPDPDSTVQWGDQTYEEMMVGFFDVAVPANLDKQQYFIRGQDNPPFGSPEGATH